MSSPDEKMHLALRNAHLERVKSALAEGADPNSVFGPSREPALVFLAGSAFHKRRELFDLMLDAGADPNIADKNGVNALHRLAMDGWDWAIAPLLLDKNANINAQTKLGMTALHFAVDEGMRLKARNLVNLLLERGADITIKNNGGKTPLDVAREHREVWDKQWMIDLLLSQEKKKIEMTALKEQRQEDTTAQILERLKAKSRPKIIKIYKPG